jgi:hypothetical protein
MYTHLSIAASLCALAAQPAASQVGPDMAPLPFLPAVSIETGMQSAAMGYALSTKHFADVLVAVPSSVSIVFMVWIGAALAVVWRMMPIKDSIPSAGQGAAQKPA